VAAFAGGEPAEVMLTPAGPLHSVRFSPDGSLLAIGTAGAVWLVGVPGWTSLRVLSGHTGAVRGLRFSADGALIVSGAADGAIRIWDARTGELVRVLPIKTGEVRDLAYTPEAVVIMGSYYAEGRHPVSGKQLLIGWGGGVRAISPDAAGCVRVFDESVPDSTYDWDRDWDTDTCVLEVNGKEVDRNREEPFRGLERFGDAEYSPDGSLVAVENADRTIGVWDFTARHRLASIAPRVPASAFAFSPDNARIAVIEGGGDIAVWDPRPGQRAVRLDNWSDKPLPADAETRAVTFSADGALIAAVRGDTVYCWDAATGEPRATLSARQPVPLAVACAPDGETVATTSADGTVRLWDTGTWAQRAVLRGHEDTPGAVAFSPDGKMLASASGNGEVLLWGGGLGEPVAARTGIRQAGQADDRGVSVAFSPDGLRLAAARSSGLIEEWQLRPEGRDSGQLDSGQASPWPRHWTWRGQVVFYPPEGKLLAAVFEDWFILRDLVLRDAASHKKLVTLEHLGPVTAAALSPDGNTVLTGSSKGAMLWWLPRGRPAALRRRRRKPVAVFGTGSGKNGEILETDPGSRISAVAFSADGTLAATGTADDFTVRIWTVPAAELVAALPGHRATVTSVAIVPGNAIAVGASLDGTVRAWNITPRILLATLVALPDGGHATLFPDGTYRVSDPGDAIWWASKLRRFAPDELDPYAPALRDAGSSGAGRESFKD
jgi:WD40 repeat protein